MAKNRFTANIRICIKDKMYGRTIVVNSSGEGKSADELLEQAEIDFSKFMGKMNTKIYDRELYNYAKHLKNSEGWGVKKIKNHFDKFNINIEPYLVKDRAVSK